MTNPLIDSVMVAEHPQGFTAIDDPQPCGKNKKTELKEDHVAANDDVEKESVLHMIYDLIRQEPTNKEIMEKLDGLERIIRRVGGINTKVITAITSTKMLDPEPADEIEAATSGHWVEARVTKWITE